jgi:hypothetical protein
MDNTAALTGSFSYGSVAISVLIAELAAWIDPECRSQWANAEGRNPTPLIGILRAVSRYTPARLAIRAR